MSYVFFLTLWTFCVNCVLACPVGKSGRDCMSTCHCLDGADCDDTSGRCPSGCARGWDGNTCQRENVAYGQPAYQKEGVVLRNASLAVDDVITTCSLSKPGEAGWWSVTLKRVTSVSTIVIRGGAKEDIQGWKIYVGSEDNRMSMQLCVTVQVSANGATVRCGSPVTGQYVMVVNRQGPVELCDFQVKVCSPRWFGLDCTKMCNCADPEEVCDTLSGACASGCDDGWSATDCQTACVPGTYGADCKYECGHCADDNPCNHVTGACSNGCKAGWTGMFCTQQCQDDAYDKNCQRTCGNCYGISACDVTTGTCRHGCEAGYMGPNCLTECAEGWYGANCSQECGNCMDGSGCDPKIGVCRHGCEPGYTDIFCKEGCQKGYYGKNCKNECEHCFELECDKVTGHCKLGCSPGFFGDDCSYECAEGRYGINCSKECGHCLQGEGRSCDHVSGRCVYGCQPGYRDAGCIYVCKAGFYGQGCRKCGLCTVGTTCDPFTGHCPQGCALSFFGDRCQQSEPFSDEDGPQLSIFLGLMITTVIVIMISVTLCLIYLWRFEQLPEMTSDDRRRSKTGSHSTEHRGRSETESRLLEQQEFLFDADDLNADTHKDT